VSREKSDVAIEITVKIRYSHSGTAATLTPLDGDRARVQLHQPQKAVTPGQAAVFYDGDAVLGGGWICRQGAFAAA
jgi:tRNA-specific 2-thiouridylase